MPTAFISYSWSSEDHTNWVADLADRLITHGVDVRLDQYDLKPGDNKYVYMEEMVRNPDITKVIVISDKKYKEKADARQGGVGTESTIISRQVYDQVKPRPNGDKPDNKYVIVFREVDEHGGLYVPIMFDGMIGFDMSTEQKYEENYEALLRFLLDQPQRKKPPLGKPPSFLQTGEASLFTSATVSLLRRAIERQEWPKCRGLLRDYFEKLQEVVFGLPQAITADEHFDPELGVSTIKNFSPYRNELAGLIQFLAHYGNLESIELEIGLRSWLERVLSWVNEKIQLYSDDCSWDHIRYLCWEILIIVVGILHKERQIESIDRLLSLPLFIKKYGGETKRETFAYVEQYLALFEKQLKHIRESNLYSMQGDMALRQLDLPVELSKYEFCQTDLILGIRARMQGERWVFRTLAYWPQMFDVFKRSESQSEFNSLMKLIGFDGSVDQLKSKLKDGKFWGYVGEANYYDFDYRLNIEALGKFQ